MIPWNEIEKRYAGLFKSHKGHPAKPLRLALVNTAGNVEHHGRTS